MKQLGGIRIPRMALSGVDISKLHAKTPWMPMWWSAALPGLGHFCQGMYVKGLLLMSWEILINFQAHLNLAILYTFTGQFAKAAETVNTEWVVFYGVVFLFAIYDSYRTGVELNMLARLEKTQKRRAFRLIHMSAVSVNYLERNSPWVAAFWSALFTGFGQIYNKKTLKAIILLVWTAAIINFSHVNDCIVFTLTGRFEQAHDVINYQWLLFFPSIYIYAIWDAYNDSVELNKLFAEAQKNHLRRKYRPEGEIG